MAPLQREVRQPSRSQERAMLIVNEQMDPPLSDWFRSAPHAFDAAAQAAKVCRTLAIYVRLCSVVVAVSTGDTSIPRALLQGQGPTAEPSHRSPQGSDTKGPSHDRTTNARNSASAAICGVHRRAFGPGSKFEAAQARRAQVIPLVMIYSGLLMVICAWIANKAVYGHSLVRARRCLR